VFDASQQVLARDVIIEVKRVEEFALSATQLPTMTNHSRRSMSSRIPNNPHVAAICSALEIVGQFRPDRHVVSRCLAAQEADGFLNDLTDTKDLPIQGGYRSGPTYAYLAAVHNIRQQG
jgi:hypothetical protein